ncbi:lysophospholipid acyltransferase family protein [Nocardioides sp. YIM 152315]|uniref:lysophospholipid acyltransferase family protein n=1 Tax=Nocardioides sp. YIM 152315 TaxID=3031760 RepID=UPI0023DC8DE1|nr:lysophospholipid acyltransferase family protein [Nocardioides sp. YIM 152315]MDF1606545.1 lysophospholipid acyltransferase family protein [Nocardioides sp. YIM 152315]
MNEQRAHLAPPRSDRVPGAPRYLLYSPLRPLARFLIRRRYAVRVHGGGQVPPTGPVIYASNHVGVIDGPLLAIFGPRPAHALTKVEMFRGLLGRFLWWSGQIPLDRFHTDPRAVKTCLRALRSGRAIGIYPEGSRGPGDLERFHRGAAYLALVSGAPVVPVTMLGSREPGGTSGSLPRRGAAIDMIFGEVWRTDAVPWPRTREQVEKASLLLREHMLVQLDRARASTGRELPGPLPPTDVDPDPATGVTDEGAP